MLVNVHANQTLTVPPFQAVFGSYRMRHLHASPRSQETGHDPDPFHLHPPPRRSTPTPILRMSDHHRPPRGQQTAACPRHAVAALDGISRAHVDWPDSKGLNQWERRALELAEERSQLG